MNAKRIGIISCTCLLAVAAVALWPAPDKPPADRDTWDVHYIQQSRIGYAHTTLTRATRQGRKVLEIEQENRLVVVRGGERTEQEIRCTSVETPGGELIEFTSQTVQGTVPLQTSGRVVGRQLQLQTTSRGKTTTRSIPWSPQYGGPYAIEFSLLREPMKPGQQRTIRALDPVLAQVVTYRMTAKDYEAVETPLAGTGELLRIENLMQLGDGQTLPMVCWCDRQGEILKTRMEAMAMETFRTTKDLALKEPDAGGLDFVTDLAIKIDRPLPGAHDTKQVRYRISLEGSDPAEAFVSGASQRVRSLGPNTAELTVYALRPGDAGNPDAAADRPTEDDRQPNNIIQSDHERIVSMAREAVGDRQDPWQVARLLERYVYDFIEEVNFSQAFATAAEVAESPVGDCTEHAVLLAAMARASGLPARAAVGLVYIPQTRSFGYHMWTEVYIDDRWIPIDATLAKGGIGAAHLKLAHSNLKDSSAYSSFLPVVRVMGRLKVEVLEVQ